MKTLQATVTNVDTNEVLVSGEFKSTGKKEGNWEALVKWAADNGHTVERRFGSTLSGKAQDGILVEVVK